MNSRTIMGFGCVCLLWVACGGQEEESPPGGYSEIANSLARPTGTLAAITAPDVAAEFEKINSTSAGGLRLQQAANQTQTVSCPAGGTYSIAVRSSGSTGEATLSYDDCCYTDACCFSGGGDWYFSTSGASPYAYCGTYDLSLSCFSDIATSLSYEGCFGTDGSWVYVVVVAGETYAVSGTYSLGNGTLSVSAANGSYTCTYSNYAGSCSGSAGSFRF